MKIVSLGSYNNINPLSIQQIMAVNSILIVDDDLLNQKVLSRLLLLKGFNVTVAKDGVAALEKININYFDLIISDINMPNLNGAELLEELNNKSLKIPFILLSGEFRSEVKNELISKGAIDVLQKPVDIDVLLQSISKI